MKNFKATLTAYIVMSSLLSSTLVFSADAPVPASFALNPESIRHQMLGSNLTIKQTLNQVHDAKDLLSKARHDLLPSVNLGGLLTLTGGLNFALTTIQFLLPFLLPSNWFKAAEQKDLYESELLTYRILELNTYSSALAMYFTVLSDRANQKIIEQEATDLNDIYAAKNGLYLLTGIGSSEDLAHAHAQALTAEVQASQMAELSVQEIAAMRRLLGFTLATTITFDSSAMNASEYENSDIQLAVDYAIKIAPEQSQIAFLVSAAESEKWSTVFGFITGATVSAAPSASGLGTGSNAPTSASFSNLRLSGSAGLGVSLGDAISLSNRNVEEIKSHETALLQQTTQVLEGNILSLKEAKIQFEKAKQAEAEMQTVYEAELFKYQALGVTDFLHVLLARTQMTAASSLRVKAALDLNIIRVTLHRAMITDQFAQIKGCTVDQAEAQNEGGGGIFGWIGRLFKGGESHDFLDQVCREI